MSMTERVSLLNSLNTLLVNDSDFTKYENWITNGTGGVLFSDLSTKPDFALTGTTDVDIASGNAIIVATRATSTPIPNQQIGIRYQLSDTKSFTGAVNGSKIFIEIDQTLINDQTLIEDTFPSVDYALGLNIGEMKMAGSYPSNPYIALWEYDGATWTDVREMPMVDGNKVDLTALTGNINTTGNISTNTVNATTVNATNMNLGGNPVATEQYVNSEIVTSVGAEQLLDKDTYPLGEDVTAGDSLFREDMVTFASATTVQNIGDVSGNTRVSIPVFGSGTASNTLKLALRKFVSPGVDLGVRIETDNAGSPSGELIDPNATATVLESGLTTSLVDTTVTMAGTSQNNQHGVTLDNTQTSQVGYKGVKITLTQQVSVVTVVKDSDCTATHAYIYDTNGVELAKTTFSTDTATFNFPGLVNGGTYYVLAGSEGSSYTSVRQTGATAFPYVENRLDYESGGVIVILDEAHGINMNSVGSETNSRGWRIQANKNLFLTSMTRNGFTNASRAILRADNGTIIATASFSGDVANFANIPLSAGTFYRVEGDANGGSYTRAFTSIGVTQQDRVNIKFIQGSANGADNAAVGNILSVGTADVIPQDNTDLNNITDITTSDTILIPKGQKAHIVLYPGTYGSETINATNYFGVGYRVINSSTRPLYKFNGSIWSISPQSQLVEGHGINFTANSNTTDQNGFRILANNNIFISSARKSSQSTATRLLLYADNGTTLLGTATFVGNNAFFSTPIQLISGTHYRIGVDNNGSSFSSHRRTSTTGYPINNTNISYISSASGTGNLSSTANNIWYDILDITTNTFNFVYTTSDLFLPQLLSKTDATYIYKLPVDFPRIATESKSAGQNCITIWKGLADLFSGLTQDADYYLANTPGAIGLTAGTNAFAIGKAINGTTIFTEKLFAPSTETFLNHTSPSSGESFSTSYLATRNGIIELLAINGTAGGGFTSTSNMQISYNNSTWYTVAGLSGAGVYYLQVVKGMYYRTRCQSSGGGATATVTIQKIKWL